MMSQKWCPLPQVMDVISENEDQFLSSLQRGSRLILRTLRRMQPEGGAFPGQWCITVSMVTVSGGAR